LTQIDLGEAAQIAKKTTADFELEARTRYPRTPKRCALPLEAAGLELIPENAGGPAGVCRRKIL
jgi:hypothetical protein